MGSLFSRSKMPAITPAVTDDSAAVKEAARLEAERMRKRRGIASTILTGPEGLTTEPSLLRTTLG